MNAQVIAILIAFGLPTTYTSAMDVVPKVAALNIEKSLDGSVDALSESEFDEENIASEIFENEQIAEDAVKEKIKLIGEAKKVEGKLNQTKAKLSQSKKVSFQAQTSMNRTQAKYDNLVKQHNRKVGELEALETKVKVQQQNLHTAESKLSELQRLNTKLNDTVADAKRLTVELNQRKSFADRQIALQKQKTRSLQAQVKKLQNENRKLGSKVTRLENQVK